MPFTENGLVIPRQPEIISDLVVAEQINIHPNINVSPDTFLGENNQVMAELATLAYEYLEKAYNQTRLSSAEGRALDEIGILKGLSRLLASESTVDIVLEGLNDLYIPSNSLVQDKATKQRFLTLAAKRILNLGCISAVCNTTTSAPSTAFTITINGTPYTRSTPSSGVNMTTTLGLLAGDINTAAIGITATSTATSITLESPTNTPFDVTLNPSFIFGTVKVKVKAKSLLKGPDTAATPGDWGILTPVPGWAKTYPIMASAVDGRNDESDEDFRLRIANSDGSGGKGTTRAVRIALENTPGVTQVNVEENTTGVTAGGIPPYTMNCVVDGGLPADIAKVIWETKGSTTPMMGSQEVPYTDENSITRVVKYDIPTGVDIDVKITYTEYPEEPTPTDWQNTLKQAVSGYINNLGLGLDVLPSKIFPPIYNSVTGIAVQLIELKEHSSPTWGTATISISASQFAKVTALTNILLVDSTP